MLAVRCGRCLLAVRTGLLAVTARCLLPVAARCLLAVGTCCSGLLLVRAGGDVLCRVMGGGGRLGRAIGRLRELQPAGRGPCKGSKVASSAPHTMHLQALLDDGPAQHTPTCKHSAVEPTPAQQNCAFAAYSRLACSLTRSKGEGRLRHARWHLVAAGRRTIQPLLQHSHARAGLACSERGSCVCTVSELGM